jgi:DNA-binding LytR/AlgR family response regulator
MIEDRNNPDCHEMRVLATNGRVFRLRVDQMSRMLLSRIFLLPLAMFCGLLALADPLVFENDVALPWRLLFWGANGAFVTVTWYLQFRFAVWFLWLIGRDIPVPSAVFITVSVTALIMFNYGMASIILEMPELWEGPLWQEIARYVAVVLVFETATAAFLMPMLLDHVNGRTGQAESEQPDMAAPDTPAVPAQPAAPEETERPTIHVNGQRIDLSNLLYLKSAEHYVEVVLHDATELVRSSLRDLTENLDPCHGVQPHRSYWVCRKAISGLNRARGGQFLILNDGTEVPVSRHRKQAVTEWLADHL